MDDKARITLSACVGAVVGGLVGYLFLTEEGRRVRERLAPGMEDLALEVRRLRGAVDSARVAVRDGWSAIDDLRRSVPGRSASWEGSGRPPAPF